MPSKAFPGVAVPHHQGGVRSRATGNDDGDGDGDARRQHLSRTETARASDVKTVVVHKRLPSGLCHLTRGASRLEMK